MTQTHLSRLQLYSYNVIVVTVIKRRLHLVRACEVTTQNGEDIEKVLQG